MAAWSSSASWEDWGVHIVVGHDSAIPPFPSWLSLGMKRDWQSQGFIIWSAKLKTMNLLKGSGALTILNTLRENDGWKAKGIIVGQPAYRLVLPSGKSKKQAKIDSQGDEKKEKDGEGWTLTNPMQLSPQQCQDLLNFLVSNEKTLQEIADLEKEERRKALAQVYALLLEKKQDGQIDLPPKNLANVILEKKAQKKAITPTAVPAGKYYTPGQAAEICDVSIQKIRRWMADGRLPYLEIADLGKVIEQKELDKFLSKPNTRS